jgi:hypothetical protein
MVGVGAAHHLTSVLVAAPLTLVLVVVGRRRSRFSLRDLVPVSLGTLIPLASYGFIAYRAFHPGAWQWPGLESDWRSVLDHVTGAMYHHFLGHFAPSPEQVVFLEDYVYPFLLPALALLFVAGVFVRGDDRRWLPRGLSAAALLTTVYAFICGVPDPSSYFLAPMAIAMAGIIPSGSWLSRSESASRRIAIGTAAVVGVLALSPAWLRASGARKEVLTQFDRRVRGMWASIPFERAIVIFANDMFLRLVKYQLLRGEKKAVEVVNPLLLAGGVPRARFIRRHGFDPLQGVDLGTSASAEEFAEEVARAINELSPVPVIVFDPQRESVRLLRKAANGGT